MENHLLLGVSEVYIVEYDITLKFFVCSGSVSLMEMLPCPDTGTFIGFFNGVIGSVASGLVNLLCIYKCNITVIRLGLLIHQLEDSVSAGKCHDDGVDLHAYLVDRHIELSVECQIADKCSESQSADSVYSHHAADDSQYHVT